MTERDWMTGKTINNRWGLARKTSVVPEPYVPTYDGNGGLYFATSKREAAWPAKSYKITKTFPTRKAARQARSDEYYIIDRLAGYVVR
jgi:hypothetical protein